MRSHATLTESGCRLRRVRLLESLGGECSLVVIADPRHIGYLSGFFTNPGAVNLYAQSYLVVGPSGRTTLITDNWQAEKAHASHADDVDVFEWYDQESAALDRSSMAAGRLLHHIDTAAPGPSTIGVEVASLPAMVARDLKARRPDVALLDLSGVLRRMRRRKDPDEVACIRRAISACEAGYGAVRQALRPGMTEFEVYSLACRAALDEVGDIVAAYGDFVSGVERTATGAGQPTQRMIHTGDLLLMDFAVLVGGYRADLCDTFSVGRRPTQEQRRRYAALESAQAAAERIMRPGVKASELYRAAVDELAEEGFRGHLGHGIGLDHLEGPAIVGRSDDVLEEGNVLTIEPGIYIEGWGGVRIEDQYLVTADGCERLSRRTGGLEP